VARLRPAEADQVAARSSDVTRCNSASPRPQPGNTAEGSRAGGRDRTDDLPLTGRSIDDRWCAYLRECCTGRWLPWLVCTTPPRTRTTCDSTPRAYTAPPDLITRTALGLPEARTLALAGGAAMIAHGFVSRLTHDVDLFTEVDDHKAVLVAAALRTALEHVGLMTIDAERPTSRPSLRCRRPRERSGMPGRSLRRWRQTSAARHPRHRQRPASRRPRGRQSPRPLGVTSSTSTHFSRSTDRAGS
jgi:hypothetical protein